MKIPSLLPDDHHLVWDWLAYGLLLYLPVFWLGAFYNEPTNYFEPLLITLLFIPIYFLSFRLQGLALWVSAMAITGLGFWAVTITWLGALFFSFAVGQLGNLRNGWANFVTLFAMAMLATIQGVWTEQPVIYVYCVGFMVLFGGSANWGFFKGLRAQKALLVSQQEVSHLAAEAERERIARDLHDLLGHTLSAITVKAELAGKYVDHLSNAPAIEPEKIQTKLKTEVSDIEHLSRATLQQVRQTISGYREDSLSHEFNMAKSSLAAGNIQFSYQAQPVQLTEAMAHELCMIIREAVTNILRHSGATKAELELGYDQQNVTLTIGDNGVGSQEPRGNGLQGIVERVRLMKGTVDFRNEGGFILSIRFPFKETFPVKDDAAVGSDEHAANGRKVRPAN